MITAQVPHKGAWLTVQVLELFNGTEGKVAYVKALSINGSQPEPFISWTHGGWATHSTTTYPVSFLRNVEIYAEE